MDSGRKADDANSQRYAPLDSGREAVYANSRRYAPLDSGGEAVEASSRRYAPLDSGREASTSGNAVRKITRHFQPGYGHRTRPFERMRQPASRALRRWTTGCSAQGNPAPN